MRPPTLHPITDLASIASNAARISPITVGALHTGLAGPLLLAVATLLVGVLRGAV